MPIPYLYNTPENSKSDINLSGQANISAHAHTMDGYYINGFYVSNSYTEIEIAALNRIEELERQATELSDVIDRITRLYQNLASRFSHLRNFVLSRQPNQSANGYDARRSHTILNPIPERSVPLNYNSDVSSINSNSSSESSLHLTRPASTLPMSRGRQMVNSLFLEDQGASSHEDLVHGVRFYIPN